MKNQYLIFSIGNRKLAINAEFVKEVFSLSRLTRIPIAPSFMPWVVNWQNSIIPVIDLSLFISHRAKTVLESHSSLIIQKHDFSSAFALVIDNIQGVSSNDKLIIREDLIPYFAEGVIETKDKEQLWVIEPDKLTTFTVSQFHTKL